MLTQLLHHPSRLAPQKPDWLRVKLPTGVWVVVAEQQGHTICTSGNCPNMGECWGVGPITS